MTLYIKPWCPWCVEAVDWLKARGYRFNSVDVLSDRSAYEHMQRISGQRLTPTLETAGGEVLADFDVRQLENFLKLHNLQPG